jgi:hypothetical protein
MKIKEINQDVCAYSNCDNAKKWDTFKFDQAISMDEKLQHVLCVDCITLLQSPQSDSNFSRGRALVFLKNCVEKQLRNEGLIPLSQY